MGKKLILNAEQIQQIVKRIAHQVYENNFGTQSLAIAGIGEKGSELGQLIGRELSKIDSSLAIEHMTITLDKENPKDTMVLHQDGINLSERSVLLVDDVMHTGKTIAYSLWKLLDQNVSKIEIAVLVDRGHRQFPISATFSGYQLATTFEEHIEVTLGQNPAVNLY